MSSNAAAALFPILFPESPTRPLSVWMVVDAARDPDIYPWLRFSGLDFLCLYSGLLPTALQAVAPYLVELTTSGKASRELLNRAWGNSWGILIGIRDSSNLRLHLRKFLRVRREDGKGLLFRYYDPRVLRRYLPTCLPTELKTVFGPIDCFWTEDPSASAALAFRFDGARLQESRMELVAAPERLS